MKMTDYIVDVLEYERFSDRVSDLLAKAGRVIAKDCGYDPYDHGEGQQIAEEEAANIIGLWAVPILSQLYSDLLDWYGDCGRMMDSVRNAFCDADCIYFVTGLNYSLFDADLLGGDGDGETKRVFCERFGYEC